MSLDQVAELLTKAMEGQPPRGNLEGSPEVSGQEILKSLDPNYEPPKEEEQEQAEEPVETQESKAEGSSDAQEESTETEAETPDEDGVGTLSQLAEELNVDVAALYDLEIPVANGEAFKIGQIKDMWTDHLSKSAEVETTQKELAENKQALETQLQQLQNFQQIPQELLAANAQLLQAQQAFQSVDWATLETTNPGAAALQRQKMAEAVQLADYNRQQIEGQLVQAQQEIEAQRERSVQQVVETRNATVRNMIPEWANQPVFDRERSEIVNYAQTQDIPREVAEFLVDQAHPAITKAFRKLWQHDKAIERVNTPPPPPKTLRTQAVRQTERGKTAVLDKLKQRAAKSHDTRVKTDAITALIRGT